MIDTQKKWKREDQAKREKKYMVRTRRKRKKYQKYKRFVYEYSLQCTYIFDDDNDDNNDDWQWKCTKRNIENGFHIKLPENVAFVRVHIFLEFNSFAMDECFFIYLFFRFVRWFLFEFGLMAGERIVLLTFWSSYIFSNGNDSLRP